MTKQTWTAAVAAVLFVVCAAAIAIAPVPYVAFAPGVTVDLIGKDGSAPPIRIDGVPTYPSQGHLLMATVASTRPDDSLSLMEALFAHWSADREVFPRDSVYAVGANAEQIRADEQQAVDTATSDAIVSGLRQGNVDVLEMPMVVSVATQGPAYGLLQPGDLVVAVDKKAVTTVKQVRDAISAHEVGELVEFRVRRGKTDVSVLVRTSLSKTPPTRALVGVTFGVGFTYAPHVELDVPQQVGAQSASLMFALGVYELVTPGDMTEGRTIAGTGAINALGEVSSIEGAREKLVASRRDGASVFLLPAENCADLGSIPSDVRVVPVSSISDAVASLQALRSPVTATRVKVCP